MPWLVLADSVIGTSHRTRNGVCQDAHKYRLFGECSESLVIAVADGAGSATHAEIGSVLVCEELIRGVESTPVDELGNEAGILTLFTAARAELVAEAERRSIRLRDLACTAILAVVTPSYAIFAQIGDGAIVIGSDYRTVFWPEQGEYANVTAFLTDDDFLKEIRVSRVNGPVTEVAVITDGLQRLALDFTTEGVHQDFFRPFFERLRIEHQPESLGQPFRQFLDSSRVNERTDDDKTLIIALNRPSHEPTSNH